MEVYRRDLVKMTPEERNATLDEMVRAATAHRDHRSWLANLLRAIQGVASWR
ncbi:MAG TPA: hypothetical protein VJT67_05675 [Longimicrobiaceae bacterium]|nr:hypothetical protein [Longimicrobiaceae bacterium]